MPPDPYARYLDQADQLFAGGEVERAGQIWQAILKQSPEHPEAKAGLLKVRLRLQKQAPAAAPPAALPPPAAVVTAQAPLLPSPDELTQVVSPESAASAPMPGKPSADELDRMLREGSTLYDMGQVEDALKKWESLLRLDPDHAVAREYAEGARRELGLAAGAILEAPKAAAEANPVSQEAIEEAEKLLREGCLLWDMGLNDDAILKWQRAMELAPHRQDIKQFLANAEKENAEREQATATQSLVAAPIATQALLSHAPAPPPPPPAPAVLSPADEEAVQTKLRQADHLIGLGRYEEAAFTLQQALRVAPGDPRIQEAFARCSPPTASSVSMTAALPKAATPRKDAPVAIEMDLDTTAVEAPDPPAAATAPAEGIQPPAALTRAVATAREGLKLQAPKLLEQVEGMPWLKDPRVWATAASAVLILTLGTYFIRDYRKDAQLKSDVEAARSLALSQATTEAAAPKLAFTREAAAAEAQEALSEDPVRAYLLTQFLLKQSPSDAKAAQLRGKALIGLTQGGAAGSSLDEFQKHLALGNLDAARQVMDSLLRQKPDDLELHVRAARLERALAEDHAAQGHFDDARLDLQRARALLPEDPAWQGKLKLLDQIRTMPKAQRMAWTPLLG